MIQGQGAPDQM